MSEELRRAMDAEAGAGPSPEVGGVWRAGRRRRAHRRWLAAGGATAAMVLALGVGIRIVSTDDAESVRAGAASASCDPMPRSNSGPTIFVPDSGPADPLRAPKTPAAMVHGGGSEHLRRPQVVARVKVLSTKELVPRDDYLMSPAPRREIRARVEVIEPVFGAKAGDRFTISNAGFAWQLSDLRNAKKSVTQQIDDFQAEIDRLNRPLAELDRVIATTDPNAPEYEDLIAQRQRLKESTDLQRTSAQKQLNDYQQRLQVLQLSERLTSSMPVGTACHRFEVGDDLVVALVRTNGKGPYELTGPSSFFLVDGDGFSDELDAARRSVPGWTDSQLLRLARESSVDEFLERLRQAADD